MSAPSPGRLHYLNADFDLSLRPRPRMKAHSSLRRAADLFTAHALAGIEEGDAVLLRTGVPARFLDYLGGHGLPVPRLLRHPEIDAALRLEPFGWNAEAASLNRRGDAPATHPGLGVVRRVNARTFSARLERELFGDGGGEVFIRVEALERRLAAAPSPGAVVVKADHGNGAFGNRRLAGRTLSPEDRRFVEGLLEEDDAVVLEPWRERVADLCAVFEAGAAGLEGEVRIHETLHTAGGAFLGALFDPAAGEGRWDAPLREAAGAVAGALAGEGYFGPVCLDAFVWRDGEEERLRPLVDLNCRREMSAGARRLRERLFPDRVLLWRLVPARALREAADERALGGEDAYDARRRAGILALSPLTVTHGGREVCAPRVGVAFVGESRDEVRRLEAVLRGRTRRGGRS